MMRRQIEMSSVIVVLATTIMILVGCGYIDTEAKNDNKNIKFLSVMSSPLMKEINNFHLEQNSNKQIHRAEEEIKRPIYKDIDLSDETLDYIFDLSQQHNYSYELLLALAKTESEFKVDAVSPTNDYGLFQLNKRTAKWIAEINEIKNYNLFNPQTNADMTIMYLNVIRDYWIDKKVSEERMFRLLILGFHYGIEGSKKYISNADSNKYFKRVRDYKSEFEQNIVME